MFARRTKAFRRGATHLLVVAIDAYIGFRPLHNAVRDAQAVVNVLTQQYKFLPDHLVELFDEAATGEGILDALEELVDTVGPEDSLMIYFAGHGLYDKDTGIGYLLPYDAKPGRVSSLMPHSDLVNYIRAIKARHTFLVMDSCFSGSFFSNDRSAADSTSLADRVEQFPSRWGLAAGRIEEVSDGQRGDHSPFAKAVLSFLSTNPQDRFPVSDLVHYVKRITSRNADQTPIGGPILKVDDMGGEFVFHRKGEGGGRAPELKPVDQQPVELEKPVLRDPEPVVPVEPEVGGGHASQSGVEVGQVTDPVKAGKEAFDRGDFATALTFFKQAQSALGHDQGFHSEMEYAGLFCAGQKVFENENASFSDIQTAIRQLQSLAYKMPGNNFRKQIEDMVKILRDRRELVRFKDRVEAFGPEEYRAASERMIAIKKGGKWGFLAENGSHMSVEPQYDRVEDFKGGKAEVELNGEVFFIDKWGKKQA